MPVCFFLRLHFVLALAFSSVFCLQVICMFAFAFPSRSIYLWYNSFFLWKRLIRPSKNVERDTPVTAPFFLTTKTGFRLLLSVRSGCSPTWWGVRTTTEREGGSWRPSPSTYFKTFNHSRCVGQEVEGWRGWGWR